MKREKNRIQENKDEETEAKDKKGKREDKKAKEQIQNLHYTLCLHIHYIYNTAYNLRNGGEGERTYSVKKI